MTDDGQPKDELDYWEPEKQLVESLSPRAGAIVRYLDAVRARAERNAQQVLDDAADELNIDVEELLRRVGDDERLLLLLASTIEAAQRASAEAKLRGLARSLAAGILQHDDAAIDAAEMLVTTLRDLEPIHIRALLHIGNLGHAPDPATIPHRTDIYNEPLRMTITKGFEASSALGDMLDDRSQPLAHAILATLVRHGLIYETGDHVITNRFYATPFGHRLLEIVRNPT